MRVVDKSQKEIEEQREKSLKDHKNKEEITCQEGMCKYKGCF